MKYALLVVVAIAVAVFTTLYAVDAREQAATVAILERYQKLCNTHNGVLMLIDKRGNPVCVQQP